MNEEDDIEKLKKCLQDVMDNEDKEAAVQMLAKYHLEGEKLTKSFCAMMKKKKETTQFCSLVKTTIDKNGDETEEIKKEQSDREEEVREYYEKLYKNRVVEKTKEDILKRIGNDVKVISEAEKEKLENPINMSNLSECLRKNRNNTSPGVYGFSGDF